MMDQKTSKNLQKDIENVTIGPIYTISRIRDDSTEAWLRDALAETIDVWTSRQKELSRKPTVGELQESLYYKIGLVVISELSKRLATSEKVQETQTQTPSAPESNHQ